MLPVRRWREGSGVSSTMPRAQNRLAKSSILLQRRSSLPIFVYYLSMTVIIYMTHLVIPILLLGLNIPTNKQWHQLYCLLDRMHACLIQCTVGRRQVVSQWGLSCALLLILCFGQQAKKKNQTEGKAKVVPAGWETEFIQFHASLALV